LHEGGIREPTVARWPAGIKAGRRSDLTSGFEDWLATFADLAGAKLSGPTTGESLLPTLKGEVQTRAHPLYREFPGYGHQQAIWDGKWKAIRTEMLKQINQTGHVTTQLYDLEADPAEATDLAAQFPDKVKELEGKMMAARQPHPKFPMAGLDPLPEPKAKKKGAK
jgi:arylsulfatase